MPSTAYEVIQLNGAFLLQSQVMVNSTLIVVLFMSTLLALYMTGSYARSKAKSSMFWSIGLWLFVMGIVEEIVFANGIYFSFLIKSYLFIVALLVEVLAMGSLQLLGSKSARNAYYAFSLAASIFLLYSLVVSSIGNIITTYVVFGPLPLMVTIASVIVTFPAAILLVMTAAITYRKTSSSKMISIIAGVIIVSIAGTLYIVSFPAFLYISEFIGILLLWFGFYTFRKPVAMSKPTGV